MSDIKTTSEELAYLAEFGRIKELDAVQRRRSEEILSPWIRELKEVVELARLDVDKEMAIGYQEDPRPRVYLGNSPGKYPTGHCEIIRDGVFRRLNEMLASPIDQENPAVSALAKLISERLPSRKVYGRYNYGKGVSFQNAIQFGHLIIDSAGDTGREIEDKVSLYDISSGRLTNIDDYIQYAEVVREYWGLEVSRTADYFPMISAIFPLILTNRASGEVNFGRNISLFFNNVRRNFRLSEEVANSQWDFDQLPKKCLERIKSKYESDRSWFELRENSKQPNRTYEFHRELFHPLLNGSEEQVKRNLLNRLIEVYDSFKRVL